MIIPASKHYEQSNIEVFRGWVGEFNSGVIFHLWINFKGEFEIYITDSGHYHSFDPLLISLARRFLQQKHEYRQSMAIIDRLIELNCPEEFVNLFR